VLNGRSEAKLEAAVTQLVADDVESSFAAFDVFDPQTVKGSIVKIEAKVGTIGILVTNVGMRHRKLPGDFSVEGGES
jgi:NADP-dependent 3-hydroxy acid dehydrogenase YdfG